MSEQAQDEPTPEIEEGAEEPQEPPKEPYDVVFWRSNGDPLVVRREWPRTAASEQAYAITRDIERSKVFVFHVDEGDMMPTTILVPAHEITAVVFQAYYEGLLFPDAVEPIKATSKMF